MKYKLNKQMINKQLGFVWTERYSQTDETDNIGRWAKICYFNGLCIAWINGYVYQEEMPKIDSRRTGIVNKFTVSLHFPINSNAGPNTNKFDTFKEVQKYVEEMFIDFRKHINK